MCRQVCTVGVITNDELQNPRSRALLLSSIQKDMFDYSEEISEVIFKCCLCGYCQSWCKGHWSPPPYIKAARADIVARGLAGEAVEAIASRLIATGNLYGFGAEALDSEMVEEVIKHQGISKNLLILGSETRWLAPGMAISNMKLLDKAGTAYSVLKDEDTSGFELFCLGFADEAKRKTESLLARIKETKAQTVITVSPQDRYYLTEEIKQMGLALDGVEVISIVEHLAKLLEAGSLRFKTAGSSLALCYQDTNYYSRYCGIIEQPRRLLGALPGAVIKEMLWYGSEAHSMGDPLFAELHADIAAKAAETRLKDVLEAGLVTVVTSSAYEMKTLKGLIPEETGIEVRDLSEIILSCM